MKKEKMIEQRRWSSNFMDLIDGFIRLELIAENFKPEERFDFIVKKFRELLADDFEFHFGKLHPVYLEQIRNKK